jgi:type I restriction enzyme S subunit
VPIKEIYEGLFDGPHATPKPSDSGPILLGISNVTEDGHLDLNQIRHISEEDFLTWTRRVLPRSGDIVFTYEATLNRYAIIPEGFRGCLGRRMALIRPNIRKVDVRFLHYYFFTTEWREVIAKNVLIGSTVDRIPLTTFPNFPVRLPPLSLQQHIASILSAYDDLIENNTRRIAILEEMARRIYEEWFVRFRFPGHEKVKMVESELGPRPEGWEVGRLDDAIILQRGFDLPKGNRKEGTVPIYAATGINGSHNEARVKGPGVVTGRSGSLGTVLYIDEDFWPLNTTLWVKEFKRSTPLHAYYLLSDLDFNKFNSGAAVPTLNRNDIHGLSVILPTQRILKLFDSQVASVFSFINLLRRKNDNLRTTRDFLLPKLISGEIDVSHFPVPEQANV